MLHLCYINYQCTKKNVYFPEKKEKCHFLNIDICCHRHHCFLFDILHQQLQIRPHTMLETRIWFCFFLRSTPRPMLGLFICPIAIAYSMGQIIKSVCICVCVCVCPSASTLTLAFLDRFSPKLAQM